MLEHFEAVGPVALAEIASRMGRSVQGLYYHARILTEAGILRQVGTRRAGRRDEALYELTAETIEVPAPRRPDARARALKALRLIFRRAERELQTAFEDRRTKFAGPTRDAIAFRARARLSAAAHAKINEHIDAIQALMRDELSEDAPGVAHSVVVALSPSP